MSGSFLSRLVRTWLVIATIDGLFASALSVFAYKSTVTRLWQGVASTVLGPSAFTGGWRRADRPGADDPDRAEHRDHRV